MAVRKQVAKRTGRPPIPVETARRNRTTLMLTDAEMAVLTRLAAARGLPLGTMLYQLVNRSLRPKK